MEINAIVNSYLFRWTATISVLMILLRLIVLIGGRLGFRSKYSLPYAYLGIMFMLGLFNKAFIGNFVLSLLLSAPFSLLLPAFLENARDMLWSPFIFIAAELNVLVFFLWLWVVESGYKRLNSPLEPRETPFSETFKT